MYQEVIALKVPLQHDKYNTEHLVEMFLAPSYVVRALAEFLADRGDEETVLIKNVPVKFEDFSVTVGDSKKVVSAYECMKHYDMPLGNYEICKDILLEADSHAWKSESNFRMFEKWFKNRKLGDEEDDDDDDEDVQEESVTTCSKPKNSLRKM